MTLDCALWLAIAAGVVAILYGVISVRWILAQPAGNSRMQEIAAAIQAGAKAYLNRQYTTIAIVGVILFFALGLALGWSTAGGFAVGAILSGLAGYIGMFISVRANVRTAQAAHSGVNAALKVAFRGGAITGMLVVGLGLLGVAGYYLAMLHLLGDPEAALRSLVGLASAARSFRSSHGLAAAFSPRAPTWAPTSSAKWKPEFPRTIRATRRSLPTTSATTSAIAPAWRPISSKHTP